MTTNYAPVIDEWPDRPLDDLTVAFPMRDIVSVRLFNQELYALFMASRGPPS